MKELTRAEEQVMQYLWEMKKGFLKNVVARFPNPKPAQTTVATVIRVLVKKEFIGYNSYGKIHEYFPLVSKKDYFQQHFQKVVTNFFSGSVSNFASFFAHDTDLSLSELEEVKKLIEAKINKLKRHE